MSQARITANTSFFMTALILQKLLSFIYFTLVARSLGVTDTGHYFFAVSFATMFSVLMDLGLSPVLIREVAKDQDKGEGWFRQIFTLKIFFVALTAILIMLLDTWIFWSDIVRPLIYLTSIIVAIDSFTLLFYAYIRGRQSLKFESIGTIIFQFIVLGLGLLALYFTKSVFILLLVLALASLFNMLFSFFILKIKFGLKFSLSFDKVFIKNIAIITLPFALSAIFAKIYAYIDTFFLKIFWDSTEVGFYSIAYKITFALQFIPLALVAAIYPAFANYFKNDYKKLGETFAKAFLYLGAISLPIALGIMALAPEIIAKIYTVSFQASIMPLQILIASIPFLFINFSLSSFLNATDQQRINTKNLGLVMLVNIILNLILIPKVGALGAAFASSASTLLLFLLNFGAVLRKISWQSLPILQIIKILLISILMYFVVIFIKNYIHWILAILVGGLFYIVALFAVKILKKEDILFIKKSIFKAQ